MKIEHIALYVKDLESEAAFFEKYFNGIRNNKYINSKKGFSSYFISFEDGARLELMSITDINEKDNKLLYGYSHIAFKTGSKEAVDTLTNQLEKDGYNVISYPRVTGDGYYESCIEDNEKNLIEITE